MFYFKLLFAFFCFNLSVSSAEDEKEIVMSYTSEDFNKNILLKSHFVKFYAPWCGHCKKLKPTWEELATKYNHPDSPHPVTVAKVDCTTETSVCAAQDVTGYPTLKFFLVEEGKETKVTKYRGTRDLGSLQKFIADHFTVEKPETEKDETTEEKKVPSHVNGMYELDENTFEKFVETGQHFVKFYAPWCGHCQRLAPIWEELGKSLQHTNEVNIAKIDCTKNRRVCSNFEVKGYPTLLWIRDGKMIEKYQGARTHEALKSFVSKMQGHENGDKFSEKDKIPDTISDSVVVPLTAANFQNSISLEFTIVKFYAPWCGHCKRLAPVWEEVGKKLVGNPRIKVAKVDCTGDKEKQLCDKAGVQGFPTLFLYKDGKKVDEYEGKREMEDIVNFIHDHLNRKEEL